MLGRSQNKTALFSCLRENEGSVYKHVFNQTFTFLLNYLFSHLLNMLLVLSRKRKRHVKHESILSGVLPTGPAFTVTISDGRRLRRPPSGVQCVI